VTGIIDLQGKEIVSEKGQTLETEECIKSKKNGFFTEKKFKRYQDKG
jgi:hypothetical protein